VEEADDLVDNSAELDGLKSESGEAQRAAIVERGETWFAVLQEQRDAIAAASPAVEDGDAITAIFTDYFDARIEAGTKLIDEFREFPTETGPNNDQVIVGGIDLVYGLSGTDSGLDFPVTQVEDQDIIAAFGEASACSGIVNVYGG